MKAAELPAIKQLTYEQMVEFLTEKKVSTACPCCGEQKHSIQSSRDPNIDLGYFALTPVRIVDVDGKKKFKIITDAGILTVTTECLNCGYLRSFALNKLLEHFASKEKL